MKLLTYSSALILLSALPAVADINFSLGSGGLKATDTDSDIQFGMGGRIQLDYSQIQKDPKVGDRFTVENDFMVRRARIYVAGDIQDWAFKAQFTLGDGGGGMPKDLYIKYKGFGSAATIILGKQKEPFSLEALESSKDISLLERSSIVEAFALGRNYGVSVWGDWGYGFYALGAFENNDEDDSDVKNKRPMDQPSLTARFVYNPIKSDEQIVHLAVSYSDRANDVSLQGFEVGTSIGAFHAQGEYLRQSEKIEDKDIDHDGFYVQAGYLITQEHRGYKNGVFKRIKPASAAGAWEVVARYESGYGKYSDFGLGIKDDKAYKEEGKAYTVGVNWYANNNVRVGLNYAQAELDESKDKGSSVRLRTQLVW